MNGNCHLMLGIATGAAASLAISQSADTTVLWVSTSMVGSIFPDIDNPASHFGKLTVPVSTAIGKVSALLGKANEHHRGIFHDIGLYAVGLFLSYMYLPALCGFFLGALSHLILDAFNPSGVPVFIALKRFHLGKVDGNSKTAKIITVVLMVLVIGFGVYANMSGMFVEANVPTQTKGILNTIGTKGLEDVL